MHQHNSTARKLTWMFQCCQWPHKGDNLHHTLAHALQAIFCYCGHEENTIKKTPSQESFVHQLEDGNYYPTFSAAQMQPLPLLALENNEGNFLEWTGEKGQHSNRNSDTTTKLVLRHTLLHHLDFSGKKISPVNISLQLSVVHHARIYVIKSKKNEALFWRKLMHYFKGKSVWRRCKVYGLVLLSLVAFQWFHTGKRVRMRKPFHLMT